MITTITVRDEAVSLSPVVRSQRCDALGAAAPVLDELPHDGVTQWLHPRPLRRQRPGSHEVLDHVAPALQVRARGSQVQPVPGLPERRHRTRNVG